MQKGDIVRLKSGGPDLTVALIPEDHPEDIHCIWFDASGDKKGATFPLACLEKVEAVTLELRASNADIPAQAEELRQDAMEHVSPSKKRAKKSEE